MLPALHHTAADAGRFVTAGIVIVRDPDSGTYAAFLSLDGKVSEPHKLTDVAEASPAGAVWTGSEWLYAYHRVDWRYAIPDDPTDPSGPQHPLLYVGTNGGVVTPPR